MTSGPIDLRLQQLRERLGWVPYFVLMISLAGTALGAWYVAKTGEEKDRTRFEAEVNDTIDQIAGRISIYENLLRGVAGLFAANRDMMPEEFRLYVDSLDLARLHPGIQGIGYSVRIPREDVTALEEEMQRAYPGFHVWPPVDDDMIHAIQFIAPMDRRNREALGYNMYSQSTRRLAMERARDTGETAASGIVRLVQEIDENVQPGFLIYLPLYGDEEVPAEILSRRRNLRGFVYAPFRAGDLLQNTFAPVRPSVAFRVFDGSEVNQERLLYRSARWGEASAYRGSKQKVVTRMRVAGRFWTLEIVSLPGFSSAASQVNSRWILIIGVLLTVILFALTWSQTRARIAAEKAAADLRSSQKELRRTETRVRRLIESNIIGIVLGGESGVIMEANEAFLSMIGRPVEELSRSAITLSELSSEDCESVVPYAFTELQRKGYFGPFEHEFVRADGVSVPALVGVALVEPSPLSWVAFVLDLTDRKYLENQLLEQKDTLETLNRVQQVVSAELSVDNVLAAVSGAAASLTNADQGGFFHRSPSEGEDYLYVAPEKAEDVERLHREHPIVTEALAEKIVGARHDTDPEGDGVLAVPVVSRFGSVVGALAVTRRSRPEFDDRDRQVIAALATQAAVAVDNATLYQDARRDRNRAEQANRAKDQFLANLSHELRTPMTAIIGWVRMLQIGGLDELELKEGIEAISRSAKAQAQLIEDILDVSRIATGKMKIERNVVDLVGVVDAAIDSVWPSLEGKSIRLRSDLPDGDLTVIGDAQRLQQVVWNLLTNSVKFTGERGEISVVAKKVQDNAEITVSDSGEGIDPEALPFIFERFRQADGTTTRTFGGLGLGLSLVDYIVRAHGGVAQAESEGKGRGATFIIRLPLAGADRKAEDLDEVFSGKDRGLDGVRVLLAEDDDEIRKFVHMILRRTGAEVISVSSALQALDHLANQSFDVLISDIAMPGETGLSLIRKIRSWHGDTRLIPAVALTAYASEEDSRRILDAGFDHHLMKPLDPTHLIQMVQKLARETGSHE